MPLTVNLDTNSKQLSDLQDVIESASIEYKALKE